MAAAACDAIQTQRWNEGEEAFEDFYYHCDDLSSVRALTDEDGELVELYDYHEYGLPTITDPNTIVNGRPALLASSAFGNPFLFTGQVYDAETRLYHYRTRQYEPRMGRFISIDSIGVWGDGANLGNGYAYVGNMPADYVDPWGLLQFDPRTSPVAPADPRFRGRFTEETKQQLTHGAQQACNRAQCALNALDDSDIAKQTCNPYNLDLDTLRQRLKEFLRTHCQGNSSLNQFKFKPTEKIDPEVRPLAWDWYPNKTIYYPVDKDGKIRPNRDIPGDLVHEPAHYLFGLDDGESGDPNKDAHAYEGAIKAACNRLKTKDPRWKDADTGNR